MGVTNFNLHTLDDVDIAVYDVKEPNINKKRIFRADTLNAIMVFTGIPKSTIHNSLQKKSKTFCNKLNKTITFRLINKNKP